MSHTMLEVALESAYESILEKFGHSKNIETTRESGSFRKGTAMHITLVAE